MEVIVEVRRSDDTIALLPHPSYASDLRRFWRLGQSRLHPAL